MPGSFIAVHYPGSIRKGDDRISQEEYLKYLLTKTFPVSTAPMKKHG